MDSPHLQLVHKNAQLETELRFVKQQLSQANEATQYLLGLLASRQLPIPTINRTTVGATVDVVGTPAPGVNRVALPDTAADVDPLAATKQEDLLSFNDEDLAKVTTPSLKTAALQQEAHDPRALVNGTTSSHVVDQVDGICEVPAGSVADRVDGVNGGPTASERKVTYHVTSQDHGRPHIPQSGPRTPGRRLPPHLTRSLGQRWSSTAIAHNAPRNLETPTSRSLTVFPSDHIRLKNIACLVEEMSEDEQALHWQKFANNFPSHTPSEWQEYYNNEIRPAYLESREKSSDEDVPVECVEIVGHTEGEVPVEPQNGKSTMRRRDSFVGQAAAQAGKYSECAESRSQIAKSEDTAVVVSERQSSGSHPFENYATSCRATDPVVQHLFYADLVNDPHQTVIISNIVPGTPLTDVLASIKAGKLISAVYLETAKMKLKSGSMGHDSAIFKFVDGPRARRFVGSCQGKIHIASSHSEKTVEATLELVRTPTQPFRPKLGHGASRVISVHDDSGRLHL